MRIETERLVLREFVPDDWRAMARYWADPRYSRFYPERDDSDAFVRMLVDRFVAAQSDDPRRAWQLAIVEQAGGPMIGNCGIRVNDPARGEANIGYELNPDYWGRGYATEAARAIVTFGFDDLSLHRIWADCIADNTASSHVMEKLGMRQEGRFREHQRFRGRWWDTLIYAILDSEWHGRRAATT
ncbi:MAG TPA: GNAT family protein [Thermomicrobiales bacterium]|nr:GNAT family protein [Thermomicrobiales bacterium]